MNFYSIRDLRTDSKQLWQELENNEEAVITNNGKPSAIMIKIPAGQFDDTLQAVRQAKAMIAINNIRFRSAKKGFKTAEEINALIDEARNNDQ